MRDSTLPCPEGTVAAQILRAAADRSGAENGGLTVLVAGSLISAVLELLGGGLRLLGNGTGLTVTVGPAIFRLKSASRSP